MSFLSILLVASAFYFAHARPDSQSWSTSWGTAQAASDPALEVPAKSEVPAEPEVSTKPEAPAEPSTDDKDYQHHIFGFMQDMNKAVEQFMTPLMAKFDTTKQDQLKTMGTDGFASYVDYLLLLIQEKVNEKDETENEKHGDSLPSDEMIEQFESYYVLDPNSPFTIDTPAEDEEEKE